MKAVRMKKRELNLDVTRGRIVADFSELNNWYNEQKKINDEYRMLPDIITINEDGDIVSERPNYDLPSVGFEGQMIYTNKNLELPEIIETITEQICRNFDVERKFSAITVYPPMNERFKNKSHVIKMGSTDVSVTKRFFVSIGSSENFIFSPVEYVYDEICKNYFCKSGECISLNGVTNTAIEIKVDSSIAVKCDLRKGYRQTHQKKNPFSRFLIVVDYATDVKNQIKLWSKKIGRLVGNNEITQNITKTCAEGTKNFSIDQIEKGFETINKNHEKTICSIKEIVKSTLPNKTSFAVDRLCTKLNKYIKQNDIKNIAYSLVPKDTSFSDIQSTVIEGYTQGTKESQEPEESQESEESDNESDIEDIDYIFLQSTPKNTTSKNTETSYPIDN